MDAKTLNLYPLPRPFTSFKQMIKILNKKFLSFLEALFMKLLSKQSKSSQSADSIDTLKVKNFKRKKINLKIKPLIHTQFAKFLTYFTSYSRVYLKEKSVG